MNKTIKLLMFSDIFFVTGFGLVDPILAIFIKENLAGGTIFAAGLASMMFLLTKSIIQLPFSRYVDEHDDKVKWLIMGAFLITSVPFIYVFAENIYWIYLAQIVYGLGSGLAYPTWLGLWSTNLDHKHESFEWSLYSTLTGLGTAATAAVGAAIAQFIGFKYTFIMAGIMGVAGWAVLHWLEVKKGKEDKISLKEYQIKEKF
ncbi:hypothetical protein COY27_00380 [Candidatus Woesearchaeota archaeon CG_4_10_14_0_2_um_filter_33_13]|nr:MAG: hypothetical protein COY27_00380 [Candidatus Woesearchaeota archaeon CG_4_10_14_0_2_um_filter_33_13]